MSKLVDSSGHADGGLRAVKYIQPELKHAEHFEDDDDNDNDSDDVEDVSVHGSGIPRRYARRQTIKQAVVARSRGQSVNCVKLCWSRLSPQ